MADDTKIPETPEMNLVPVDTVTQVERKGGRPKGMAKTGGRKKGQKTKDEIILDKIKINRVDVNNLPLLLESLSNLVTHLYNTASTWEREFKVTELLSKFIPKNVQVGGEIKNKFEIVVLNYLDEPRKKLKPTGTDASFKLVEENKNEPTAITKSVD